MALVGSRESAIQMLQELKHELAALNARLDRMEDITNAQLADVKTASVDHNLKIQALRIPITDPPVLRVIHTPELLEHILLALLPHRGGADARLQIANIFVSKRVCKQFRDIIEGSPALQSQIFMRATHTLDRPIVNSYLRLEAIWNNSISMWSDRVCDFISDDRIPRRWSILGHIKLAQFYLSRDIIEDKVSLRLWLRPERCPRFDPRYPIGRTCVFCNARGSWREGASWSKAYLTQPPIDIYWELDRSFNVQNITTSGGIEGGCRAGELLNIVCKQLSSVAKQ
ncbi:hypothetical protein EJ03DRAFT_82149 [Teratosphaeria nubilosa]|uniref:F-box domain-containing protein n=1 Tax=Teratosphaeria nubilosa TaxID=161662 RepID=A0A6G1LBZ1_9PEZI|nr:hypothetical protein EJ03DRAFT_82149 [Teratosphaeria nubilosa]